MLSLLGRQRIKRRLIFTGALVVLVLVVLALRVSTQAQVILIEPSGFNYQVRAQGQYNKVVAQAIGSSIYNQLKITISTADISSYVEDRMPEVYAVSVTVPFVGTTPKAYIQLKVPQLMLETNLGGYLLDSQGEVIAPASALTPSEQTKIIQVQDPGANAGNIGQIMLTANNVSFIRLVSAGLAAKTIKVAKMTIIPGAEELDVYLTGQPYYVKFNLHQNDAMRQLGAYLAAVANLGQRKILPSQYIDVMVDGRVYYH